jgi:hypothetical protein
MAAISIITGFVSICNPGVAKAGTFYFYTPITLSAVQLSQLGLSSSAKAVSEGTYTAAATWEGSVAEQDMSVDQVYTTSVVQRNNITIWYYRYNKNTEKLPTFTVTYRILSTTGTQNRLSHATDTSSTISATITADPVSNPSGTGTYRTVYGYADLTIDVADAKKSGTYTGTIEVTINYI